METTQMRMVRQVQVCMQAVERGRAPQLQLALGIAMGCGACQPFPSLLQGMAPTAAAAAAGRLMRGRITMAASLLEGQVVALAFNSQTVTPALLPVAQPQQQRLADSGLPTRAPARGRKATGI